MTRQRILAATLAAVGLLPSQVRAGDSDCTDVSESACGRPCLLHRHAHRPCFERGYSSAAPAAPAPSFAPTTTSYTQAATYYLFAPVIPIAPALAIAPPVAHAYYPAAAPAYGPAAYAPAPAYAPSPAFAPTPCPNQAGNPAAAMAAHRAYAEVELKSQMQEMEERYRGLSAQARALAAIAPPAAAPPAGLAGQPPADLAQQIAELRREINALVEKVAQHQIQLDSLPKPAGATKPK